LPAFYAALRPAGVVAVIDHYAAAGTPAVESVHVTHRIDPTVVVRDFVATGFLLEAESASLRNPDDDYSRNVFDPTVRRSTDRFVMRFRATVVPARPCRLTVRPSVR
jgi:predicted methyltransferase